MALISRHFVAVPFPVIALVNGSHCRRRLLEKRIRHCQFHFAQIRNDKRNLWIVFLQVSCRLLPIFCLFPRAVTSVVTIIVLWCSWFRVSFACCPLYYLPVHYSKLSLYRCSLFVFIVVVEALAVSEYKHCAEREYPKLKSLTRKDWIARLLVPALL